MNAYTVTVRYLEPVEATIEIGAETPEFLTEKLTEYFYELGAVDFKIMSIEPLTINANFIEPEKVSIN